MHEREAAKTHVRDRKQTEADGRSSGASRKFLPRDLGLDDRISAEEVELLEKKQAMVELLKERRRTKVERHSYF